jgi:replicative DNA helicase
MRRSSLLRRSRDERALLEPRTIAGRVPPHDLDAEAAVLSAMLLDRMALDLVVNVLLPEHFYSKANGAIFEAAVTLSLSNSPVDIVTVAAWLRDRERLQQVGGASYLAQIADAVPSVANVEAYAKVVREKWRVRQLIAQCQRIAAEGYGDVGSVQQFLEGAEQTVYDIAHTADEARAMERISASMTRAVLRIAQAADRGERVVGTPTGFHHYDKKTSGLHDGELTIVAARPGMGKTAFVMAVAVNVAAPRRVPTKDELGHQREVEVDGDAVVVFSLEMPKEQLALRSACAEGRVDGLKARSAELQPADWSRLTEAAGFFTRLPIWIDDTPSATLLDIRSKVRRIKAEYEREATDTEPARRLKLVVVDYLQLARGEAESREQEIAGLSRGLKALAKELGVHVIALSQLNRAVETRAVKDKRPQLSDLRESGAIEQDADTVVFIYRDEYYNPETTQHAGLAELIIAKQRNGPTGKVLVRFDAKSTRFDNLAPGECPADMEDD